MSWRQELDALLPPDRADAAPITNHLRGLLEALHNGQGERPRITITLEQDAWTMLEAQFRRPYRPHSSYTLVALDVGTVAFERRKDPGLQALGESLEAAKMASGKPWPEQPPTTAPSDAVWPEGPFPRPIFPAGVQGTVECFVCGGPCRSKTICHEPECTESRRPDSPWCSGHAQTLFGRPVKWDATAIEAKAAALSVPADANRPEGAIYTAPMTGAEATYGGPWKEPK